MYSHNPSMLSVDLEFTNLCNVNCTICPRNSITRKKGFLSEEVLKIFIKNFRCVRPLVTISGMGDPLLHPYFARFISLLKENGFKVGVVVNIASLLNRFNDICEKIVQSPPHQITLSIPSIESETIKRIYRKDISINEIKDTLKKIIELCDGKSQLRVWGIITAIGENRINYKKFFNEMKIPVWINKIHSRGGNLKDYSLIKIKPVKGEGGCNLFLFHTFIAQNGDILSCCHDLRGETVYAHISEKVEQIIEKKREIIKKLPFFHLCKRCDEPLRYIDLPENYEILPKSILFKKLKIYRG